MAQPLEAVPADFDAALAERVRQTARRLARWYEMPEIELGRRLGLARTPLYNRMQGLSPFTAAEIGRMAEIFQISPAAFYDGQLAVEAGRLIHATASASTRSRSRSPRRPDLRLIHGGLTRPGASAPFHDRPA